MRKILLYLIRSLFPIVAVCITTSSSAQQNVIADKDNTRPEITRQFNMNPSVVAFNAVRNNGYNDIQWTSRGEKDTRKFVVEYSTDGIYFQSAGEVTANASGMPYQLKHQTFEIAPMLYRMRAEDLNGRVSYTQTVLLDGVSVSPVKIYPTIVTGNIVNVNAEFPIERITVLSGSGQQVYTQDINGKTDYMAINIPALGKGVYWMSFTGQGWKTSSKFIIP